MKVESRGPASCWLRARASNSCLMRADFSCSSCVIRSLLSVTSWRVGGSQGPPGGQPPPAPRTHLTCVRSRFCSFSIRMVCCCQPGAGGEAGARAGPGGPEEAEGRAYRRAQSGRPGTPGSASGGGVGRGTHRASTGRSQQLPQAAGHLLHLGQQSPQWAGAPLSPKLLKGSRGGVVREQGQPRTSRRALRGSPRWPSCPRKFLLRTQSLRCCRLGSIAVGDPSTLGGGTAAAP